MNCNPDVEIHTNKDRTFLWPLLVFALGVILRYALGSYLKAPSIVWDEIKYYGIARSLYQGLGITLNNCTTNFQKVLYSVVLSPLFAIDSPELRIKMIALLNSVLMNSCVFPLWFICQKLGLNKHSCILTSGMLIIWPDMVMTESFMSENLYWPLFFWFIAFHFYNNIKNPILCGALEGTFIYAGYLCKEVFITAIPTILACILLENKLCNNESQNHKKDYIKFAFTTAAYGLCFLLGKMFLFSGLGKGYNQQSISALGEHGAVWYLFYSILYYIIAFTLSVMIFPVLTPILNFKKMPSEHRKFFLFIGIFILFVVCGIAYTISIREDLENAVPRLHFRYFAPAVFWLIPVFLLCPQQISAPLGKKDTYVLSGFAVLTVLIFRGANDTCNVDQMTFQWFSKLNSLISSKFSDNVNLCYTILLFILYAYLVLIIGAYILSVKKRKCFKIIIIAMLIISCIICNICAHINSKQYYTNTNHVYNSVIRLSNYFYENEGNILLMDYDYSSLQHNKIWICCFDNQERMYYYTYKPFIFVHTDVTYYTTEDNNVNVSDYIFSHYIDEGHYATTDHIDYVVIPVASDIEVIDDSQFTIISELSDEFYTVYKNNNPTVLKMADFKHNSD